MYSRVCSTPVVFCITVSGNDMTRSSKPSAKVDLSDPELCSRICEIVNQTCMVKIAQTFAFGREKANQGGLSVLTIGFFQQNLDSWTESLCYILCSPS